MTPTISNQREIDRYAILKIKPTATAAEITRAYRKGALLTHPDKCGPQSAPAFRAINEAYELLKDPASRRRHDARLRLQRYDDKRRQKAQLYQRRRQETMSQQQREAEQQGAERAERAAEILRARCDDLRRQRVPGYCI